MNHCFSFRALGAPKIYGQHGRASCAEFSGCFFKPEIVRCENFRLGDGNGDGGVKIAQLNFGSGNGVFKNRATWGTYKFSKLD